MALVQLAPPPTKTPDDPPWNVRQHNQRLADHSRSSYDVDRDRIIHSTTFRDLQYKTQVQSLFAPGRAAVFRTRLNHVLEVAQIARSLARLVGADEALAEAIALAHDLGHPPFGHAGERALRDALRSRGREGWNANVHSLEVVDRVETAFIAFRGLNLTLATREGIARHSTPFDEPVSFGEFTETPNGGLECQIVDVADVYAYLAHDLDDALLGGYLNVTDLQQLPALAALVDDAEGGWLAAAPRVWPESERETLVRKRVIATLIHRLIHDTAASTVTLLRESGAASGDDVRLCSERVVAPPERHAELVRSLLDVLVQRYYRSDDVAGADDAAARLMTDLLNRLIEHGDLTPARFRLGDAVIDAATYLASLNDFAAVELAQTLDISVVWDQRIGQRRSDSSGGPGPR